MDGLRISNANRFIENAGSLSNSDALPSGNGVGEGQKTFADTLKDTISKVNELQLDSDHKIQQLATGKTDDVAAVMISTEKAEIALRTMVQVRNKIIDAYQEIMRMQV